MNFNFILNLPNADTKGWNDEVGMRFSKAFNGLTNTTASRANGIAITLIGRTSSGLREMDSFLSQGDRVSDGEISDLERKVKEL